MNSNDDLITDEFDFSETLDNLDNLTTNNNNNLVSDYEFSDDEVNKKSNNLAD